MKKQETSNDRLCTMTQTAKMLNVSVDTVRRLISERELHAVRIYDMPRIEYSEIQRFIKSLKTYR